MRVPENYDAYLTQKYGDWRADLPEDMQKSHHKGVVIDTERSYKNYVDAVLPKVQNISLQ